MNIAEKQAELKRRRANREKVDAYLAGRRREQAPPSPPDMVETDEERKVRIMEEVNLTLRVTIAIFGTIAFMIAVFGRGDDLTMPFQFSMTMFIAWIILGVNRGRN